ncbi:MULTISPECIES: hypothetical protein [unclassified Pedobacter]|uniref:hypothetical protein n=1 Tax=unclassified Pedobacter TaxID=2628915 RepID=UPI001E58403E|nr:MULTISPECIES: hypothetical protein [unclassified Pedobacter]
MKKITALATAVACFALFSAKAQTINGVRLSDIHADYVEIKGSGKLFSDKILISLEYGQIVTEFNDVVVKDDAGKRMEFNSTIDFINKFKNYGYELFQVYSEHGKDSSNAVYVMKRK